MDKKQYHEVIRYLLYLFSQEKQVLNTYLTKQLTEKFNLSRYQVYRLIQKLRKSGIVEIQPVSKKLSIITLSNPDKLIDLIMSEPARNHETNNTTTEEEHDRKELLRHARKLLKPRWRRQNSNHKKATEQFMLKSTLTEEEREEVTALFELWLMDIEDRILWFKDVNGEDRFMQYTTRFNSKQKALEIIKKAETTFRNATSLYKNGIFLTVTLPPIFPQRLALWILTYLTHRIKALIRRRSKESKPHFRVNEPQNSWNPHTHIIIFGTDFLMPKHELTRYLEKHLINFLQNLGRHYKRTINKNATDYDVLALNELGQIYIKKYNKYKKQKPKYEGVINWITRVFTHENDIVFENPPPDANKHFSSKRTATDGGMVTVFDYIKYYMISAVVEAQSIQENGISKIKNLSLVWYWFHRQPFFLASPKIRPPKPIRQPSGWTFLGSFNVSIMPWILERMQQASVEVYFK